ncbi:hypothetical protein Tco_1483794 [Tanacetum coccineum]
MEISIADQIALDDALVAPADRLKIGKCNLRLSSDITSKEATLQVVYDVLKLTPFYNYKAVRLRFSDPMIQPEPEGSTQGYPLVSVEVLSHGPSDAMHNPLPATQSQKDFVSKLTEIHSFLLTFSLRMHVNMTLMILTSDDEDDDDYDDDRKFKMMMNILMKTFKKMMMKSRLNSDNDGDDFCPFPSSQLNNEKNVEGEQRRMKRLHKQRIKEMRQTKYTNTDLDGREK